MLSNDAVNSEGYMPYVIDEWVCRTGRTTITKDNRSSNSQSSPSATLSNTNFGFSSFQRDSSALKKVAERPTETHEYFSTTTQGHLPENCLIFNECSIHLQRLRTTEGSGGSFRNSKAAGVRIDPHLDLVSRLWMYGAVSPLHHINHLHSLMLSEARGHPYLSRYTFELICSS